MTLAAPVSPSVPKSGLRERGRILHAPVLAWSTAGAGKYDRSLSAWTEEAR
jgi:hypothetical protein